MGSSSIYWRNGMAKAASVRCSAGDNKSIRPKHQRLCAVTTQEPMSNALAVAVPDTEKCRAGLYVHIPLWVIIDEHHVDVFEQSYYIEPQCQMGMISAVFKKKLQHQMILALQCRFGQSMKRSG